MGYQFYIYPRMVYLLTDVKNIDLKGESNEVIQGPFGNDEIGLSQAGQVFSSVTDFPYLQYIESGD